MKKIVSSLALGLVGGFIAFGIGSFWNYNHFTPMPGNHVVNADNNNTKLVDYRVPGPETHVDFTNAAQKTVDAVVHVKTAAVKETNYYSNNPFFQFFHGDQPEYKQYQPVVGIGSGVIISSDGYIVTNNHVVNDAEDVEVTLNNKKSYKAKVIGTDPQTDLAVIKIDANNLPYITYGNSDNAKVGQWVLAVGNPYNLTSTVTAGIISAKDRNINILSANPYTGASPVESYIQTDAAVNPGNSGGALVNTNGQLIGINSAIKSNTGSYTGYSFAIPSNLVKKVADDIIQYGSVQRAFLGVTIRNIDEKLADQQNLKTLNGVYVDNVSSKGAAKQAGIQKGDVIIGLDGKPVINVPELQEHLGEHRPGDKITAQIMRNGKTKQLHLTLRNYKGSFNLTNNSNTDIMKKLGAQLENVPDKEAKRLGIDGGVKISKLYNGALSQVGVGQGFVITQINNQPVSDLDDLNRKLKTEKGGVLISGIYPNGRQAYYGFGMQ